MKGRAALLLIFGTVLGAPRAFAAPGTAGAAELRILTSARATGMGESSAGLADSLSDAEGLNPAGLGQLTYNEASFSYLAWVQNISLQNLSYAHPTNLGTFAIAADLYNVGSFNAFDASGAPVGTVDAHSYSARLSWGGRIWGPHEDGRFGIFAGGGIRYLDEQLATAGADDALFDVGLLARIRQDDGVWGIGASALSLGGGLRFDQEVSPAPTVYRTGVSYVHPVLGDPLSLVLDVRFPGEGGSSWGGGLEYLVKGIMAFRVGYTTTGDLGSGFRAGVGFNLKFFQLDYALASLADFGLAHRASMSVRFGPPLETSRYATAAEEDAEWHYRRARKMYENEDLYQAVLELDEALKLNPNHAEALDLLRTIRTSSKESK